MKLAECGAFHQDTTVLTFRYRSMRDTCYYREKLGLSGTPIRIEFKSPVNPFEGQKKN